MKKKKNKRRAKLIIFIIVTLLIDLGLAYKIATMCQETVADEELLETLQPSLQEDIGTPAKQVAVLTYHNIGSDDYVAGLTEDKDEWISESRFKEQMKFLSDNHYVTLEPDEFFEWQQGEIEVPEKSVLITFDGGAYNVVKYGCPVLRDMELKATAFVRGKDTPKKTDKDSADAPMGMDVLKNIEVDWPELTIQSQTYGLSSKNIKDFDEDKMIADCETQDEMFESVELYFVYISNPYGELSEGAITALEDMGYVMAFDGGDRFATRKDHEFRIPRITIKGDASVEDAYGDWCDVSGSSESGDSESQEGEAITRDH